MNETKEDRQLEPSTELDQVVFNAQPYFGSLVNRLDGPMIFDHRDPKYKNHPLLPVIEKYVSLFSRHECFVKEIIHRILSMISGIFCRGRTDKDGKAYSIKVFKERWEQMVLYARLPVSPKIHSERCDMKKGLFAEICCAMNGDSSFLKFYLTGTDINSLELDDFKTRLKSLVPEVVSTVACIVYKDLTRMAKKQYAGIPSVQSLEEGCANGKKQETI
jgi:hypothetical protein